MRKSCLATYLRTVNFKRSFNLTLFSVLSIIKAEKDDSVEDTGNGTEKENTGGEEGEEDEEGEGEDVDEEEDEDVRKQISSLSVRGGGGGGTPKSFIRKGSAPRSNPDRKGTPIILLRKGGTFTKQLHCILFLNPWNEVK